ncbi:MAG TPA: polysaccharide deacetylase family protein [Tepidisphaeraceae bacterium]|nr:polysaccharide deacetylase family protein [Tepidisphaeraceae bacterium]
MSINQSAYLTTSWDDGHPADFRVAELLGRYNLRGTFYVPREARTGTLDESSLRTLGRQVELGAHTMHHVFLTHTSDAIARREIEQSKAWVEDLAARPCTMFCPPGGKFHHIHLKMIREAGFAAIRSVELMSLSRPRLSEGLLVMPTTLQAFPHRPVTYLKNAWKRWAAANLWRYLLCGPGRQWHRLAETLLENTVKTGGVFHLWGHSWEVQVTNQWERLEELFKLMSQYAADAPCVTNSQLCEMQEEPEIEPLPAM